MPGKLSPGEVEHFKQEGYVLIQRPVFGPRRFEALKERFEMHLAQATASGGTRPEDMNVPHFTDPKLFEWLFADEVLDLVEPLIGPDIALWTSHFLCKPAGTGKRVPWHEDSAYWGKLLDPMEVVTVWLAIDPATRENGCMRLIPRTHHNGYSQYQAVSDKAGNVFANEIKGASFDEKQAVDCVLRANECSIHHAKLVHGSEPNASANRRCGYLMRYVPASSKFNPEVRWQVPAFRIYLARGSDRAGNTYGDPTQVNEAWLKATPAERNGVQRITG